MAGGILSSLLVTVTWALCHVAWCHARSRETRVKHLVVGWLCSLPLLAVALPTARSLLHVPFGATPLWEDVLYACVTSASALLFAFLYYGSAERSVTVRLLIELNKERLHGLTLRQFQEIYSVDDMIRRRLSDMERSGLVASRDGRWFSTAKGSKLAALMRISNRIFQSAGQHERI